MCLGLCSPLSSLASTGCERPFPVMCLRLSTHFSFSNLEKSGKDSTENYVLTASAGPAARAPVCFPWRTAPRPRAVTSALSACRVCHLLRPERPAAPGLPRLDGLQGPEHLCIMLLQAGLEPGEWSGGAGNAECRVLSSLSSSHFSCLIASGARIYTGFVPICLYLK